MTWPTKTDFIDGDVLTAAQVNNVGTNLNLFDPTSANSGEVPIADGAGSVAFGTLAVGGWTSIASGSLPTGSGTLTLSSIPATYEMLRLQLINWSSASNAELQMRINNISTSSYHTGYFYWVQGSSYTQNQYSGTYMAIQNFANTAAGTMSTTIDFPQYAESTKQFAIAYTVGTALGGTNQGIGNAIGQYTTAAILNRIDVILNTGNYDAGTYILWGLK